MKKTIRFMTIAGVLVVASLLGTYWIQQYLQSSRAATSKDIIPRSDLLSINSTVAYQAPLRYEQRVRLEKGGYTFTIGAKMNVKMGSGMAIVLICNEDMCGTKRRNEFIYSTSDFPLKTVFSEMKDTVTVPEDTNTKEYILRIFCEDGSECEIDYISLVDAWGNERVRNPQFDGGQQITDSRNQPTSWEVDSMANMYGSVDPTIPNNGGLVINNSSR